MHHGTVLKTLLLLLSVVAGLHRILGQNSFFFFFNGRYRFFYRPLRGCAGFQVRILFFFCNGHYCFRYRLLRGCGGFWVKILFLKKNGPTVQFDRIPIQSHAYCKRPIHQFFQYWIRTTKEMNKQGWQAY